MADSAPVPTGPLCLACDGPIKDNASSLLWRNGRPYHRLGSCFKCDRCAVALHKTDAFAWLPAGGEAGEAAVCLPCVGYTVDCVKCRRHVVAAAGKEQRRTDREGRHWHTACFRCELCNETIGDTFTVLPTLSDASAPEGGRRYPPPTVVHSKCAVCSRCHGGRHSELVAVAGRPYCEKDARRMLARKQRAAPEYTAAGGGSTAGTCRDCNEPILNDQAMVVLDNGTAFHRDCFACAWCVTHLLYDEAGNRLASVPANLYIVAGRPCHGEPLPCADHYERVVRRRQARRGGRAKSNAGGGASSSGSESKSKAPGSRRHSTMLPAPGGGEHARTPDSRDASTRSVDVPPKRAASANRRMSALLPARRRDTATGSGRRTDRHQV